MTLESIGNPNSQSATTLSSDLAFQPEGLVHSGQLFLSYLYSSGKSPRLSTRGHTHLEDIRRTLAKAKEHDGSHDALNEWTELDVFTVFNKNCPAPSGPLARFADWSKEEPEMAATNTFVDILDVTAFSKRHPSANWDEYLEYLGDWEAAAREAYDAATATDDQKTTYTKMAICAKNRSLYDTWVKMKEDRNGPLTRAQRRKIAKTHTSTQVAAAQVLLNTSQVPHLNVDIASRTLAALENTLRPANNQAATSSGRKRHFPRARSPVTKLMDPMSQGPAISLRPRTGPKFSNCSKRSRKQLCFRTESWLLASLP
ncbi:hypothetical protein BC832DRAFT_12337 [Gaertneriomyces semiglobifer]|nr:hypothetical protein BC832DRAFT_12337 [Gaertneriomyces semiglobifer]